MATDSDVFSVLTVAKCQRCGTRQRRPEYRFCTPCIAETLKEMADTGYLTQVPAVKWDEPVDDVDEDDDMDSVE